ncbi:MAG: tetraacyldisaccharide 4'-kinase [Holosporaceae bacterium]|jgi:tetraacyldisaccharide 4'-kinase|nr:tetraacyldisaccharide 4'-kinase [Holosporaceae bacterium]
MIFFRTPDFWYHRPSAVQRLFLKPIANIYSYISTKNYCGDYLYKNFQVKVIAVGGVTVGGSGKTLVVQSISKILQSQGKKVAVLSRGFGRLSKEILRVNDEIHSHLEVGDEPLLLARSVPVYVGKDRAKTAQMAQTDGAEYLILDDGITQKYLKPDLKFLVIDEEQRFGNGEMFPLGPNRLNFEKIKFDIDGIITLGRHENHRRIFDKNIPSFRGKVQTNFSAKKKIIAFCGLGYPNKFFNSLGNCEEKIIFPDHYSFSNEDIEQLLRKAENTGAQLVTTEKDFMRISEKYRNKIISVGAFIVWETPPLVKDSEGNFRLGST